MRLSCSYDKIDSQASKDLFLVLMPLFLPNVMKSLPSTAYEYEWYASMHGNICALCGAVHGIKGHAQATQCFSSMI
jgi:hypothetical protein